MTFRTQSVQTSDKGSGGKRTSSFLALGLVFSVVLVLGWVLVSEYRYRTILSTSNPGDPALQLFEIEKGSSVETIGTNLEEKGFILSSGAFEKYAKRSRIAEKFQAGRFYLPGDLTIPEMAEKLLNAKEREEFLTIPEGLTLEEIDERIAEKGYALKGDFLKCVRETCDFSEYSFLPRDRASYEGYFFPETYAVFVENFSPDFFAKKMLDEFKKRAEKLGILDDDNLNEIVIMASMIEKESRADEERPVISGILWKRLREGWVLGVDATVRYFTGKKSEELTYEELNTDNPYNTRVRTGLPPTAISNPGEKSLEAAANPVETDYYFYLHGSDGLVHYAETNEEHNRNKEEYL